MTGHPDDSRTAADLLLARRRAATVRLERERRTGALARALAGMRTGTASTC